MQSFEEFKTAVLASLRDKVAERIDTEREHISNALLRGKNGEEVEAPTPVNADEN